MHEISLRLSCFRPFLATHLYFLLCFDHPLNNFHATASTPEIVSALLWEMLNYIFLILGISVNALFFKARRYGLEYLELRNVCIQFL